VDQQILVEGGRQLAALLTKDHLDPRAVLWVNTSDNDEWKLWIVPDKSLTDRRAFYQEISKLVSEHRGALAGLDSSDVELVMEDHPAIKELRRLFKAPKEGPIHISKTMLNGFYLSDAIILKMDV
jgi:hypothetical protein